MIPYVVSQVAEAVVAAGVTFVLFKEGIVAFEAGSGIVRGVPAPPASHRAPCLRGVLKRHLSWPTAFFAEAYGAAILAFVVFALTNIPEPKPPPPISDMDTPPLIGATVGPLISVVAPLIQAGFNPARDFRPRIVAWLRGGGGLVCRGGGCMCWRRVWVRRKVFFWRRGFFIEMVVVVVSE